MSRLIGRTLRITREVPWPAWHAVELPAEIKPGAIVHEYRGYTWGCMAANEIAVSLVPGEAPFWGIPEDCLEDWPGVRVWSAPEQAAYSLADQIRAADEHDRECHGCNCEPFECDCDEED
jgi:hypothetical protein